MMREFKPLGDKIIGMMCDPIGSERSTKAGLIIRAKNLDEDSIRPRWFEVTHVGPEQDKVKTGDYVLVPHGRWSRGIDLKGTMKEEDKFFLLDNEELLMISDVLDLS